MTGESTQQRAGLSLYANLLDNDGPGTISGAPVTYSKVGENGSEQDDAAKKQQALAASLRFQPTKRPQLAAQKAKAKAIANKLAGIASSTAPEPKASVEPPAQIQSKTTAADWIATVSEDEDVNAYYAGTRTRGKKRKKKNKEQVDVHQDWDDIYDPSRPNNYEEYKHSEEKFREVREWKDLLYRHRMQDRKSYSSDSSDRESKPMNRQFAPPPMSFAPPADLDEDYVPPPPPPEEIINDASGDDAYLRRLRMSQTQASTEQPPPPPPDLQAGQISRAPVRYNLPPPPPELPESEAEMEAKLEADDDEDKQESQKSTRPGQKGFAERLLSKYGWTKGSGLGAQGQGIINPLYAKADKRKKKSDAEGGGYVTPASTGKILGGNKSAAAQKEEVGRFGPMSEVIRLDGMLNGIDVTEELNKTDGESGGLMQEIGEECSEKYGSVERVFIHMSEDMSEGIVFVRFVSQLSALRAVNALEGRIFNGNAIKAKFWDREKFDLGQYS